MKCPNCGAQSDGAYCSQCGAPLKGAQCGECQAPLLAGAHFCTNCGAPARAGSTAASRLPWAIAAVSIIALIIVLALPALRGTAPSENDDRQPISQMDEQTSAGTAPGPGPLSGTPREQADRLFNRVMTERANGDTAQARFFVPMAVQAYQMAGDLDADAYYHVSLLHQLAGDYAAALQAAERILATSPNHLLGLSAAANATAAAGDSTQARAYYRRLLDNFDAESKTERREYRDHANMLPEIRKEAEAFVAAR